MEDAHANPLFFHDNPASFVTIRGDPTGQESQPLSSFGYTDPFHARDAEEEDGACVMTAEEEALLQTLQNKKNRSRARKEPVNPLLTNVQGSSTRRPYPVYSGHRSPSPKSPISQESAHNAPINLTPVQLSRQSQPPESPKSFVQPTQSMPQDRSIQDNPNADTLQMLSAQIASLAKAIQ